nr:MAG TPA: hypothetical protein [Caudoviricetes sp.]
MRGEYRKLVDYCAVGHGTTSACAENTAPPRAPPRSQRNYLRVRGEYPK